MKRGTKCIAQTINLSNPETCIRPKRIQKLVEADAMQPCPTIGAAGSSYWTPRPVAVRICTRRDMQRACPPKLCDCPQKGPAKSSAQKLCSALLFLLKSSVAAGLVYWTHSEGLWGSSADVEDLYRRIMDGMTPPERSKCDGSEDEVELPRVGEFKYRMIQMYNRAVFTIMNTIVDASCKLCEKLRGIVSSQKKEDDESLSGDDSKDPEDQS